MYNGPIRPGMVLVFDLVPAGDVVGVFVLEEGAVFGVWDGARNHRGVSCLTTRSRPMAWVHAPSFGQHAVQSQPVRMALPSSKVRTSCAGFPQRWQVCVSVASLMSESVQCPDKLRAVVKDGGDDEQHAQCAEFF